jgi:hypothetical protein
MSGRIVNITDSGLETSILENQTRQQMKILINQN